MTDWLVKHFIQNPDDKDDPAVRQRYGLLSGGVGILLNLLLSAGKFLAGLLTGSIAVTADAFNNLSDAGSSVVTLAGFRLAAKQADDDHPFGHGRIEYLTGLLVAAAILLVGVELARTSLEKILQPEAVDFSWLSVGILCASILVKLWMSAFNRRLSRRIGSAAMAATAADSLSDVVATSAVLLGTLAGHFFSLRIDGWVGILVAAFILRAGWEAAKDTLDPLLGQSPDPDLVESIQKAVLAHPQVTGVHDLIIHDYGPGRRMMSLHAEVPMDADVLEVHDVIDNIERELKETFHIEAVIHMDPIATKDPQTNALREKMAALVREIDPAMTIHDFRMTVGPDHQNLIFDVVVPHKCPLSDEEVKAAIAGKAGELEGGPFFTVVSIDRSYTDIPAP
ncbi:MAG TPA: cation diffusion facilitator family transporter [Candidatus Intestinimonas pullistercoris]|uniref:Cation diffusion facilitator family transporter n=1 Tax=Candidatus Intestinimonas pullistercoris TaxID=2838623 RepID=A0A9D2NWX1_9FIRM|nr:cation diffusion facilitator family transporter [uncultured Intestinimonas sp.]HJC39940.1 cation diffusion facilitator family transporter [Candidatus Intestinimonas pullistercoris]